MIGRIIFKYRSFKRVLSFKNLVSEYRKTEIPKIKIDESKLQSLIDRHNTEGPRVLKESDLLDVKAFKESIVTTYFILKRDPQFGMIRRVPNINYIAPWYDSVKKINGFGIIIHDGLDEEFIKAYSTTKIKFVKFNYGSYSIFEERWIGYYLLLKNTNIEKAFFTDCNDVFITSDPFSKLKINNKKLYVGRDQADRFGDSRWVTDELDKFQIDSGLKAPKTLYHQPLFNAGVVGGDKNMLIVYISQILNLLFHSKSEDHKDMTLVNWALHNMFVMPLKDKSETVLVDVKNDFAKECEYIISGYPLNSPFKSFEFDSDAIFIHK